MIIVEKFEQILLDFLKANHPRKVNKVPGIVEEFRGNEVELLKALCYRYRKDYSAIPELKKLIDSGQVPTPVVKEITTEEAEPTAQLEESNEEESDELDDVEETDSEKEK